MKTHEQAMTRHILQIQLRACEGAVLRALGLMERRGYRLQSCQVDQAGGDGRSMQVMVESQRPAELLKRQLERLHDVLFVRLDSVTATDAGAISMGSVGRSR